MRLVEFAGRLAFLAPGLDELSVLGKLDDARIGLLAVTIGDKNVAIGRDQHVGGRIEMAAVGARYPWRPQRHEHLALGRKLDDGVALAGFAVFGRDADAV